MVRIQLLPGHTTIGRSSPWASTAALLAGRMTRSLLLTTCVASLHWHLTGRRGHEVLTKPKASGSKDARMEQTLWLLAFEFKFNVTPRAPATNPPEPEA